MRLMKNVENLTETKSEGIYKPVCVNEFVLVFAASMLGSQSNRPCVSKKPRDVTAASSEQDLPC